MTCYTTLPPSYIALGVETHNPRYTTPRMPWTYSDMRVTMLLLLMLEEDDLGGSSN